MSKQPESNTQSDKELEQILIDLVFNASDIQERYYKRHIDNITTVADMREKIVQEAIAALKAREERLVLEARLGMIEYYDQVTNNKDMDWKSLLADNRKAIEYELSQLTSHGKDIKQ